MKKRRRQAHDCTNKGCQTSENISSANNHLQQLDLENIKEVVVSGKKKKKRYEWKKNTKQQNT